MFKHRLAGIALLVLFGLMLSACGSAPAAQSGTGNAAVANATATKEPIKLNFYYPVDVAGPLAKVINQMVDDFNQSHKDIQVTPVFAGGYAQTMTKVQTAVQGGNPPDVAVLLSTDMQTLIDMNAIVPLDSFVAADPDGQQYLSDFFPAFMTNAKADGKIWSIPFQRSTIVMYYNKQAFKDAGLNPDQPPATWDELVKDGERLTKKDASGKVVRWGLEIPSDGFTYWMFQALAIENGQNVIGDAANKVTFDDPKVVEALKFWVNMQKQAKIMPEGITAWASTPSDFLAGKAAMIWHSTGSLTYIRSNASFPFGVAMLPAKAQRGSPTGGGDFYIFKGVSPEHQKAAWTFVRWMTEPKQAAYWSQQSGYIAVRQSAYALPEMKSFTDKYPDALVARDQLQYAQKELATHQSGQVQKVLSDALQAALLGSKSPAESLAEAQQKADAILSQFK